MTARAEISKRVMNDVAPTGTVSPPRAIDRLPASSAQMVQRSRCSHDATHGRLRWGRGWLPREGRRREPGRAGECERAAWSRVHRDSVLYLAMPRCSAHQSSALPSSHLGIFHLEDCSLEKLIHKVAALKLHAFRSALGLRISYPPAFRKSKCQKIRFFDSVLYNPPFVGTIQRVRKQKGLIRVV